MKTKKLAWPKYIPKNLSLILGKQIINDTLVSSYLLYGPGKKIKTAKFLAKMVLCQSSSRPCHGQCCRMVEKNIHPDLIIVKKEKPDTVIKIGTIRQLIGKTRLAARQRVVIIYRAEQLNEEAANAMLKTLEEPSSKTIFILTTSNIREIIPTIASRCQKYYFQGDQKSINIEFGGRVKLINQYLNGDLIMRFKISQNIGKDRNRAESFLRLLESFLKKEIRAENNIEIKKKISRDIKKIIQGRALLKLNISAKLILEEISLNLKSR